MNAHIERLAREAGLPTQDTFDSPIHPTRIEAFARLIAEDLTGIVAPVGKRPCTCNSCDCGNSGDLIAVTDWDTSNALAKAIRERYK